MTTTDFGPVHNSVLELTDRLRETDAYPLFPVVAQAGPTRARIRVAGRATEGEVTVLASADYLGLAHHPEVRERAADALRRFGTGTYGSQAVGGFTELHEELERTVADWFDRPAALLFPSGLQANLGVLGTLAGPGDTVFLDRFDHGSLTMGARLSGAGVRTFRHNDTAHLEELLNDGEARQGRRLIVVDGLFSADGDLPPLREIADLARRHQALLIVDEAHSAGALGARGRGAAELLGVLDRVDVLTGTFSKSFASTGGYVCANERVVDLLRHTAGAYLLTLGLSPATVGAVLGAFEALAREGAERRRRLAERSEALRRMLREAGVGIGASQAHVVVVPTGTVDRTARIARRLVGEGLLVGPLFPPAVPIGGARLRLGVTAAHSEADLQRAVQLISAAVAGER
ncbi:aminotransferase class I/II-fold pyridoxal phosphate-dependent enzyme [Streptomyces sp. URMC 127]|uniref:aminotransferase class I/II-fold pyridoxal phosphate-dependent enzyme n=1 Tax=Streptomyces sp. URMC 127 TaxID=3423402 RepID=UPI003F1D179A